MAEAVTFDKEKADLSKMIYEYAMNLVNRDASLCVALLVKIVSLSCSMSADPVKAFAEIHTMLDEYEETGNILNKND